jgi:chondroitin 4-sulfotransferase 11
MIKKVINKYKFYYYCRRAFHRLELFRMRNNCIPKDFIRKKIIFIHIPKSAGNAITRSLFNTESMNLGGHTFALHYFEADESSFNSCFKFTFSRHPVSRFISAFNFLKIGGMTKADREWSKVFIQDSKDIHDFIRKMRKRFFRNEVLSYCHFIPQHDFVCGYNDEILVDYVGKYENIIEDIDKLRERFEMSYPLEDVNVTAQKRRNDDALNAEEIEFIENIYSKDLEIFSYQSILH